MKNTSQSTKRHSLAIALLRIAFGLVWAIDAYFIWQPAFANNFVSYLQETYDVWRSTCPDPGLARFLD